MIARVGGVLALPLVILLLATAPVQAASVDVALILAIDVSLSVNDREYDLQREGIARAFESPALAAAVAGGKHRAIDALVLEWSDPEIQVATVPWTRVEDARSAKAFAAKLRATKRTSHGLTAIGSALQAAQAAFRQLPDLATRRVIDVSGDGMANVGPQPVEVRDALIAEGITINGLTILNDEPWVSQYYDMNVVGGTGAFLMEVEDYHAFAAAMQQKLLSEIVALPPRRRSGFLG
ncbi:MAG TPA: DUF1194 domain-containing protein [Stellaceae bacterium]|nr:DUF1194 domain-containing protein [Stellaceae bacterium]